ncbi:MAG: hypothetical protein KDE27_31980 [Planctomycetes bacterium]|nr:hypothetical protein [Planctomycetota bacterium]
MYPESPINRLVAASGGAAAWSLDLPAAGWLVGLTIQIQAAALDPTAAAPLTMSNLGTLHIGQ